MRKEYDFSKGVRGKFFKKGAEIRLPIYLNKSIQAKVQIIADNKGKDIGEIVNNLLQKELELIEEYK